MPPLLTTLASAVAAFPAMLLCNVLAVLVSGPGAPRRAGAVALCGLGFVVAALLPPPLPALRGWLWLAGAMMAMRVVDVLGMVAAGAAVEAGADTGTAPAAKPGGAPDAARRLTQLLMVYDPRDMRPAAPRFPVDLLLHAVLFAGLAGLALFVAASVHPPWRWLAGGVHFYALLEAMDGGFRALFAAMGLRARPLQDHPLRARTLAELWGRRWNREVGRWIHRVCFAPLARRGRPALGVLAGFTWSALFHGAAAWAAAGASAGALMASFFLAHGALMLVERPLGVARWPRWAGHAWVLGVFAVTVPLFAEPFLRLMGVYYLAR